MVHDYHKEIHLIGTHFARLFSFSNRHLILICLSSMQFENHQISNLKMMTTPAYLVPHYKIL